MSAAAARPPAAGTAPRDLRRALWALGVAFALVEALVIAVLVDSPYATDTGQMHAFAPLIAASFFGTGAYAWWRRPESRVGVLMVGVGFAWLSSTLIVARPDGLFAIGWVTFLAPYAMLPHLLLTFPSGRAQDRLERWFIAAGYTLAVGFQVALGLVHSPADDCICGVPGRAGPLQVTDDPALFDVVTTLQSVLSIVLLIAFAALLVRRRRRAGAAGRHVLAPVDTAAAVMVVTLVLTLVADLTSFSDEIETAVDVVARLAMACVPLGFLAGIVRARLTRAAAVSELVARLSAVPERRADLRDALAATLGDPGLALAFRVGDGYVDGDGRPVELPAPGGWTAVERDGRAVGAILHSPQLAEEDPAALRTVAGAVALALETERLDAELRARIEELRSSRARIVAAADAERRRLERDLHDGAQQRLVALALTLRLARGRLRDDDDAAQLLDDAAAELAAATAELRELARGLHPAVLADRGLGPAIGTLAGRSPVPVEVRAVPPERLPAPVEAAAYFVVAEALTNVARYAAASHAAVRVTRANGSLTVEVSDDGVGGADPAAGSGLRGLADRVAALDGRLELASEQGAGTTLRAVLPCAW